MQSVPALATAQIVPSRQIVWSAHVVEEARRHPTSDTIASPNTDWSVLDSIGPSPRAGAAIAYDPLLDRVVLFGGYDGSGGLSDTWVLRDGIWTPLPAASGPPGGSGAMTYDPVTGVISLVVAGAHWELSGVDQWTRVGDAPAVVSRSWLVFDVARRERLLLGSDDGTDLRTWAWTGQAWALLPRAAIPHGVIKFVVADRMRGGLIGHDDAAGLRWAPGGELEVMPPTQQQPPAVRLGAAANDLRRRCAIVFGGDLSPGPAVRLSDATYQFDGAWTLLDPATKPSARRGHAMTYDRVRDRVVLFGGEGASGALGDTWLWDGTTWTAATPTPAPPARHGHAMTYDPVREVVVLFGGANGVDVKDDTWEWDGSGWRAITTSEPGPRVAAMMAPDPLGNGVILFGGSKGDMFVDAVDETWRFTGTDWVQLATFLSPGARIRGTLTFAPHRRRLLLVGGERESEILSGPLEPVGETWEWDGVRWRELIGNQQIVVEHAAMFRPDGARITTVGGRGAIGLERRFELRWEDGGSYETCTSRLDADGDGDVGCADQDCWATCTPLCLPDPRVAGVCSTGPSCGDGACSPLESPWTCPSDCQPALTPVCGDGVCDPLEVCAAECQP